MTDPITVQALTQAMDTSAKVAQTPGLMTIADRLFGFKLSEWKAQGDIVKAQMHQEYKEATEKGLGMQYATAFREKANVLNTLAKATDFVKEGFVRDVELDEDVFWNLIDHAKTISREDVQELIAKIIAGEYNEPGTYTMSTLQTIKSLGRNELDKLEKLGSLLVNKIMIPDNVFRLVPGYTDFIKSIGISFTEFQTLQSLGLVHTNTATRKIENPDKKNFKVEYFDKAIFFKLQGDEAQTIEVPGFYSLTDVGIQLLQHLNPSVNDIYYEWLKTNYKIGHYNFDSAT